MIMPAYRNARPGTVRTPARPVAQALLLAAAVGCFAPATTAQDEPIFQVPKLEDVDPSKVEFNDRILERNRNQPGMGDVIEPPATADRGSDGSAGGRPDGVGGSSSSGGYGRSAPTIFQGGPQMPGSSSGDSGSDGGGIDVNVSVNGQPMPSVMGGGMPGMPGIPGSSGGSSGSSGADGNSNGDGGIDVNVNVVGGPQMPTFNIPGLPGMPGADGSGGGMPGAGMPGAGMPGMPGMPGTGSSDGSMAGTGAGGMPGGSPDGVPGGTGTMAGGGVGNGRRTVLDRRLEESFGVFDGILIAERERAQREADAAGSSVMGTGGGGDGEEGMGEDGAFGLPGTIIVAGGPQNSTGGGILPGGAVAREGDYAYNEQASYPVPEDIPNGNDDDVVARQLREAAMAEPDPELREKLWDEYRKYTGLPIPQ